jgi:hypothetical protein
MGSLLRRKTKRKLACTKGCGIMLVMGVMLQGRFSQDLKCFVRNFRSTAIEVFKVTYMAMAGKQK